MLALHLHSALNTHAQTSSNKASKARGFNLKQPRTFPPQFRGDSSNNNSSKHCHSTCNGTLVVTVYLSFTNRRLLIRFQGGLNGNFATFLLADRFPGSFKKQRLGIFYSSLAFTSLRTEHHFVTLLPDSQACESLSSTPSLTDSGGLSCEGLQTLRVSILADQALHGGV